MVDLSLLVKAAIMDAENRDEGDGLPLELIASAARLGLSGLDRPSGHGGRGMSAREVGEIAAELGAVSTALRSLLTVGGMVAAAVDRWGTEAQRSNWLPRLANGGVIAGLAATEPEAGTDLSVVSARLEPGGADFRLSGRKVWVTFGAVADVLLVLARAPGGLVTVLVDTTASGVRVEPVGGQLGMRDARLAHVSLDDVRIAADQLLAPPGFGLSHVIGTALDHGRFTIAWGALGMADACLEDAARHVLARRQGGVALADHETVRAALGRAQVEIESARALCERAAHHRSTGDPVSVRTTVMAKYTATRAAARVSAQAVQLLGAAGCAPRSRVSRFFNDAKVLQIIEGSDEVAEVNVGDYVLAAYSGGAR